MAIASVSQQLVQWAKKNNLDAQDLSKLPAAQVAKALGAAEDEVARAVAALKVTGFEAFNESPLKATSSHVLPNAAPIQQRDVHPVSATAAAGSTAGLEAFVGTWRRVSGAGPDSLKVTRFGNDGIDSTTSGNYGGPRFLGVNQGLSTSQPWHGSSDAPGGTVINGMQTTLKGERLETVSNTVTKPGLFGAFVQVDLRERTSFELKDGKLVYETEAALFHKGALFAGQFDLPTHWNTTNIQSPERPLQTAVYERA